MKHPVSTGQTRAEAKAEAKADAIANAIALRSERVRAAQDLLARYWGGIRSPAISDVATALRELEPADRELLGASIPISTGLTGTRCERLRQLFAGIAKE